MKFTTPVLIANLSHPISEEEIERLSTAIGQPVQQLFFKAQFDLEKSLRPQVATLANQVYTAWLKSYSPHVLVVLPPALGAAAYLLATELVSDDGRTPPVLWMRREGLHWRIAGIE